MEYRDGRWWHVINRSIEMEVDEVASLGSLASLAGQSLDKVLRVKGKSLNNTLHTIAQVRSLLYSLERTAETQARDIEVAFAIQATYPPA